MHSIRVLSSVVTLPCEQPQFADQGLTKWASGNLPGTSINDRISNYSGLDLLRIAEQIKDIGGSCSPDSVLSQRPDHEMLEGLFTLVDFLLGEDANSDAVNTDDVHRCRRDRVFQMLRALRAWEGHRAVQPIGIAPQGGPSQAITWV